MTDAEFHANISTGRAAGSVAKETLEVMGENASRRYLTGQAPDLNRAIVGVIKEASHIPLREQHVQRVIEHANERTYLTKFEAVEAGKNRYITFPVATKAGVAEALKEASVPMQKVASARVRTPDDYRHGPRDIMRDLLQVFPGAVDAVQKNASEDDERDRRAQKLLNMERMEKMAAMGEELRSVRGSLRIKAAEQLDRMKLAAKEAILEERATPADVLWVVRAAIKDDGVFKLAAESILGNLKDLWLLKTAAADRAVTPRMQVNVESDLFKESAEFDKTAGLIGAATRGLGIMKESMAGLLLGGAAILARKPLINLAGKAAGKIGTTLSTKWNAAKTVGEKVGLVATTGLTAAMAPMMTVQAAKDIKGGAVKAMGYNPGGKMGGTIDTPGRNPFPV